MKLYLSMITALLCTIISFAQNNPINNITASRNGVEKSYKPGSRMIITYKTDSSVIKMKGHFMGVTAGNAIMLKKNKKEENLMSLESITTLKRIRPNKRIVYGITGTVLIGTIALLLDNAKDTPDAAMRGALLIPFLGAGVYMLYAIPVTLLLEKLNEKKRSKGWEFR